MSSANDSKTVSAEQDRAITAAMLRNVRTTLPPLDLTVPDAVILVGQIQLALRHPANTGPSAMRVRDIALHLQTALGRVDPVLEQLCKLGWDKRYDL